MDDGMNDRQYLEYLKLIKNMGRNKMNDKKILDGMAEIYHYNCHKCGQGNLSRDEVSATKSGYICLKCLHARKSSGLDKGDIDERRPHN